MIRAGVESGEFTLSGDAEEIADVAMALLDGAGIRAMVADPAMDVEAAPRSLVARHARAALGSQAGGLGVTLNCGLRGRRSSVNRRVTIIDLGAPFTRRQALRAAAVGALGAYGLSGCTVSRRARHARGRRLGQARGGRRPPDLQLGAVHGPRAQEGLRGGVRRRGQRGELRQPRGDGHQAPGGRPVRHDLADARVRVPPERGGPPRALRPLRSQERRRHLVRSTTRAGGTRTPSSRCPTRTTRPASAGATTRSRA